MAIEKRASGSSPSLVGVGVTVVVGIVGALIAFKVLAFVAGIAFTVVKFAILIGVIYLVAHFFLSRRRS